MPRLRLIASVALALVLALPGTVLAAAVDLGGTVTAAGGGPAAGVQVDLQVEGSDEILATTTDADGSWAFQVDGDAGMVVTIIATGARVDSEPDEDGCVTQTTPTGRLMVTIEALPVAPIDITLDGAITSTVCTATEPPATPPTTRTAPEATPPSTDGIDDAGAGTRSGTGTVIVLLVLAGLSTLLLSAVRRPRGRNARR